MFEIINKIRQQIGDKFNKLKNVRPSQKQWKNLDSVQNIVIVSDITPIETEKAIVSLRGELKKICPNSKVMMISYYDKKVRTDINNFVSNQGIVEYFTDDDISFFYKITSDSLKSYLSDDYDMAIMIAKGEKPYLPYIFRYVRAALRIGNKVTNDGKMNFVINTITRNPDDLNKEILKYLKMFFS